MSDTVNGMRWTREKPTKPGWYWCYSAGTEKQILDFGFHYGHDQGLQPRSGQFSTQGWEWFSGPIPEPTGQDEKS